MKTFSRLLHLSVERERLKSTRECTIPKKVRCHAGVTRKLLRKARPADVAGWTPDGRQTGRRTSTAGPVSPSSRLRVIRPSKLPLGTPCFREIEGGYHHYGWRGPSRLTRPGKEGVEDSQSHRPSTALTEHTTSGRCSGGGHALELSCICWPRHAGRDGLILAFVPRTAHHGSDLRGQRMIDILI
jgi:hypothetical protein